jgi:hypothetical protein
MRIERAIDIMHKKIIVFEKSKRADIGNDACR